MPSLREIRRRIRSVRNVAQITKAMEMVAAARMRRAQAAVLASRPYADRLADLIAALAAARPATEELPPLLRRRPARRIGVVLLTTDRGLCGPLNTNIIRHTVRYLQERDLPSFLVVIGRKGRDWCLRHGLPIAAEFSQLGDRPALVDTAPIARIVMDAYIREEVDEVHLFYTQFVSTLVQRPFRRQLLPVQPPAEFESRYLDYLYEPDPQTVLGQLLPRFVEVQVYQAVLEAIASEHSARMVAMHNATQNARDIIRDLTLSYNKTRQASITKEMLEIASGAEALRQAAAG